MFSTVKELLKIGQFLQKLCSNKESPVF